MADTNLKSSENFQNAVLGQNGYKDLSNARAAGATELFCALEAYNGDAVISATNNCGKGDNPSSRTLKDGRFIYGRFDEVVVTSGNIRAYYL